MSEGYVDHVIPAGFVPHRDEQEWLEAAEKYILRTRLDKGSTSGPVLVSGEGSVVWGEFVHESCVVS